MIYTAHPSPQPKRHLHRFSRFCTDDRRVSLYFTMGRTFPRSRLPLPMGGCGPQSNTWFPGPTRVFNPNGIAIGAAVFAGLTSMTDRQTDRPTDRPRYSVGNNRPHTTYVVLRCGLIITTNGQSNLTKGRIAAARGQHSLSFTMGHPFPPLKIAPSHGSLRPAKPQHSQGSRL